MSEQTEENFSEKTLSDDELYPEYTEPEGEWNLDELSSQITQVYPDESASQVFHDNSEVDSETSAVNSTVWLYFDKNPPYAQGFNVCKMCSSKYKITTSVTSLRKHLIKHQLQAPPKKHAVTVKTKDPFGGEEQKKHDEYLVDWIICDLQPFTVVDNNYFRKFIGFFCPRYAIPDRHKVKSKFSFY